MRAMYGLREQINNYMAIIFHVVVCACARVLRVRGDPRAAIKI